MERGRVRFSPKHDAAIVLSRKCHGFYFDMDVLVLTSYPRPSLSSVHEPVSSFIVPAA